MTNRKRENSLFLLVIVLSLFLLVIVLSLFLLVIVLSLFFFDFVVSLFFFGCFFWGIYRTFPASIKPRLDVASLICAASEGFFGVMAQSG
jgi:hypothetical protein